MEPVHSCRAVGLEDTVLFLLLLVKGPDVALESLGADADHVTL